MKSRIRKFVKWGGFAFILWITAYLSYDLFIREWRVNYAEKRVQKSILSNYEEKETEFKKLIYYLDSLSLNPVTEIEIGDKKSFNFHLNSHAMTDSIFNDTQPYDFSLYEKYFDSKLEFELLKNGIARINLNDSIIETHNWSWEFIENRGDVDFEKVINYIGITEMQLDRLRELLNETNCEAVFIHKDNSMSIRYDGFSFCQYEYHIPADKSNRFPLMNEIKVDDNIYAGLNRSGIFCGSIIYDK